MQRGAASSPVKKPVTEDTERPPSKRRRTDTNPKPAAQDADLRAVQAALAAEEAQRQRLLDRQAAEAGDTKWSIDIGNEAGIYDRVGLNVVTAGYSAIDSPSSQASGYTDLDVGGTSRSSGRRSFGNFGKTTEVRLLLVGHTGMDA